MTDESARAAESFALLSDETRLAILETLVQRAFGDVDAPDTAGGRPGYVSFDCEACGFELRDPVGLTLASHPAVVSHYHDHGRDVRDDFFPAFADPENTTVDSTDPFEADVTVSVDGDDLVLRVDEDLAAGVR